MRKRLYCGGPIDPLILKIQKPPGLLLLGSTMTEKKAKRLPSMPASEPSRQSVSTLLSSAILLFAVGIGLGRWSSQSFASNSTGSPAPPGLAPQAVWSLPTHDTTRKCSTIRQKRQDGGTVRTLQPDCFPNPWLSIHTADVGMTAEFARKLLKIANHSDKWYARQDEKNAGEFFGYTQNLRIDDLQLASQDTAQLQRILRNALDFIRDHYWMSIPEADVEEFEAIMRNFNPDWPANRSFAPPYFAKMFAMPTIVKYDAAVPRLESGKPHKDFRYAGGKPGRGIGDVSFIVLLSNPNKDFDGGGTWFHASDEIVEAEQGMAVFWSGQLYHGAAPITRGQRLAISMFTTIDEYYWNLGRSLGTTTRVELY